METILVPHHDLSYNEADRRHVDSFTVEEIRKFDKQTAVHYARAVGLKETGMSVNEVGLLYDMLEKKGPCSILELGRNYACSTRLFLQHVVRHGGTFQSWDLKHWGNVEESFKNQGFSIARQTADDNYSIHDGNKKVADIMIKNSRYSPITPEERWIDFLLIDTEHGIEDALGEYMRFRHYLRSGAMVAFHDSTLPGVVRAIEVAKEVEEMTCPGAGRICREYKNERVDGYGIQILEWKS